MVLLNDLIDMEFPEFVEKIQQNQSDLTEELVNAESKGQGDLYDVILKNPTPRELKQYNQDWWRVTVTKDGNFWFAYMYDWVHNDLIDWLVGNKGYEFDSEVARIIFYEFKMTPLLNIVVDSHEEMDGYRNERSEEDIQAEYNNKLNIIKNSNYIRTNFPKALYKLERRDEEAVDMYETLNEEVESNKKVVAYHGSQTDNLQFHQGRALYLTDNYDLAKELALKDGDGGLYDGEIATVYTCRLDIKKPYETYSEAEYERYFIDIQLDRNYWLNKGYDSIIVHPTEVSETTYYIMLNPEESVKIIKKEIFEDGELMDEILIESSNTNEYKNEFESRVQMHKSLVNKYAQQVGLSFPQHDIDKFEKPLSDYYWLDMKSNYEPLTDKEKAYLRKAGMFHRINSPHHPEFWDKENIQNMTDIKSDPIKPFNVQNMPEDAMIEMCADWCAMSEEFGNTPFEWFEYVNGNRYIFNSIQKEFIEDVLAQMWNNGYGSSVNSEDDDINEIIELGRLYG